MESIEVVVRGLTLQAVFGSLVHHRPDGEIGIHASFRY